MKNEIGHLKLCTRNTQFSMHLNISTINAVLQDKRHDEWNWNLWIRVEAFWLVGYTCHHSIWSPFVRYNHVPPTPRWFHLPPNSSIFAILVPGAMVNVGFYHDVKPNNWNLGLHKASPVDPAESDFEDPIAAPPCTATAATEESTGDRKSHVLSPGSVTTGV